MPWRSLARAAARVTARGLTMFAGVARRSRGPSAGSRRRQHRHRRANGRPHSKHIEADDQEPFPHTAEWYASPVSEACDFQPDPGTRAGTRARFGPLPAKEKPRLRGFSKRMKRLELSTFCMASRRSSQLSYIRESPNHSSASRRLNLSPQFGRGPRPRRRPPAGPRAAGSSP